MPPPWSVPHHCRAQTLRYNFHCTAGFWIASKLLTNNKPRFFNSYPMIVENQWTSVVDRGKSMNISGWWLTSCPTHSFCVSDFELILRSPRSLSVSHDVQQFRQLRSFQPASMWKQVQIQETTHDQVTFGGIPLVGKLTVCYGKWSFIYDIPIKDGDFQ